MAEKTYEIPEELLREMMSVCDLATEAWGDRKANAVTNAGALEASQCGYRAAEAWQWLVAIQHGLLFAPIAFGEVHCMKCGYRKDTGEPHDCGIGE